MPSDNDSFVVENTWEPTGRGMKSYRDTMEVIFHQMWLRKPLDGGILRLTVEHIDKPFNEPQGDAK